MKKGPGGLAGMANRALSAVKNWDWPVAGNLSPDSEAKRS